MTEKEKLKSYYKHQPPIRFIRNKFFCAELEKLYEDKMQIICLQYAVQLLWVAEVVWVEDTRLTKSRVQDLIIDELCVDDLLKVVREYRLTSLNLLMNIRILPFLHSRANVQKLWNREKFERFNMFLFNEKAS